MLLTISARDADLLFGVYRSLPGETPGVTQDRPTDGSVRPEEMWRMRTDPRMTADELALAMRGMLGERADEITGAAVLSTVPGLRAELRAMLAKYYPQVPVVVIEPGVRTGVPLLVDNPKEVGPDRLVNALAAHRLFPENPCIVVDFGTATVLDAVSAKGEFLGGAFAPGIGTALDSLATGAAALRTVELLPPRSVIGKTTVECLQSGVLYSFAAGVEGLIRRIAAQLADTPGVGVVASGDVPATVLDEIRGISRYRPDLTLLGLALAYVRNNPDR